MIWSQTCRKLSENNFQIFRKNYHDRRVGENRRFRCRTCTAPNTRAGNVAEIIFMIQALIRKRAQKKYFWRRTSRRSVSDSFRRCRCRCRTNATNTRADITSVPFIAGFNLSGKKKKEFRSFGETALQVVGPRYIPPTPTPTPTHVSPPFAYKINLRKSTN